MCNITGTFRPAVTTRTACPWLRACEGRAACIRGQKLAGDTGAMTVVRRNQDWMQLHVAESDFLQKTLTARRGNCRDETNDEKVHWYAPLLMDKKHRKRNLPKFLGSLAVVHTSSFSDLVVGMVDNHFSYDMLRPLIVITPHHTLQQGGSVTESESPSREKTQGSLQSCCMSDFKDLPLAIVRTNPSSPFSGSLSSLPPSLGVPPS